MPARMHYARFDDIESFRRAAVPFLLDHEAEHGLLLSVIASWNRISPDAHAGLVVDDGGSVAVVAVRRDWRLLVSRAGSARALAALGEAVRAEPCGAVLGAPESAQGVAAAQGRSVRRRLEQGIYETRRVVWPARRPDGRRRVAETRDEDVLTAWHVALSESLGARETPEAARASVAARIADGALNVWDVDGQIVASAAAVGATPHGIRINLVYTRPKCRNRGYASYLVADLTQQLLDTGRDFVFLHTDLANPTSNAIYQRIGYERVADFLMLQLE